MKDIRKPLISIITPCLNDLEDLANLYKSIFSQSFEDYEWIIIDGRSLDGTIEFLEGIAKKDSRIEYASEADNGIYDAMNKGIRLSGGQYLYFIGADDLLFNKNTFENISEYLNGIWDVVYGNVKFKHSGSVYDGKFNSEKLMFKNISHQAIFYKRTLFDELGLFDITYFIGADWEFNLRWIGKKKYTRKYIDQNVAIFNEKGISSKHNDGFFNVKDELIVKHYPKTVIWYNNIKSQVRSLCASINK